MSNKDYYEMGYDIIKRFKFSKIPTDQINIIIDDTIINMKAFTTGINNQINNKSHNKISTPKKWNLRYMYLLPKLHKKRKEWLKPNIPKVNLLFDRAAQYFTILENTSIQY
ncbi:hypothetical protein RF11_06710 [Thelohanellus kitauei]|uniref:Uncharacterized protein n=1 Tax=Thelohanellus kitauei TaxID=669202 RepID=A0A0C2MUI7_THEKT|nr:hypothetical protein RF11_06710 [Thelohanellus kitauei]